MLTRRTRPIAGERFFLLGDATGYVEPFTGEGIAWALLSGQAIAPLVEKGIDQWDPALPRTWSRLHRRLVMQRQLLCRGVALLLRHPKLASVALVGADRLPRVAELIIRHANTPPLLPLLS